MLICLFLNVYSPVNLRTGNFKFSLKYMGMEKISLEMDWHCGMHVIEWLKVLFLDQRIIFMDLP